MNIDAMADHIASTLKRCYSIALGILKLLIQIRSISVIPDFKLLNILGFIRNGKTKQIKEIAEIHVMCDMTWIPPPSPSPSRAPPPPRHYPYGHNTMGYLHLNIFLGSELRKLRNMTEW